MFSSRLGPSGCFDERRRRRTGSRKNAAKTSAETLPLRLLLSPPLHLLCVLVSLQARVREAVHIHGRWGNLSQTRPGPESAGQKFCPRLASSPLHMSSGPFWTEEKRRRRYALGPGTPRLPLPHEVIQMLAGESGREEQDSWRVRGGRAGRALAGPHPVALIRYVFSFLPQRSSAGALFLFHSLFHSVFSLSLLSSLSHCRRGCI